VKKGGLITTGVLAASLIAVALWRLPEQPGPVASPRGSSFDFYLVALTAEPAFCEDGNHGLGQCRRLDAAAFRRSPLVLHGLWPENLEPRRYPVNCAAPPLRLEPGLRQRLLRAMPGLTEGLAEHQWRKHGSCSGLSMSRYFEVAMAFTERSNAALGSVVLEHAGQRVSASTLRAAANEAVPGFAQSVVFMCKNLRSRDPKKRARPYLYEVRVCVDNDGPGGEPGSLLSCASVRRRDQGCGTSFWIDDV
jgi:ribonuclease T2